MAGRRILATTGLPYANGHIHLGHLVGYLLTDMWSRFQRMRGNRCVYFCGDDTHGTAIMIRARQEGRGEEALIADMHRAHREDFDAFGIRFDHYGSTHSPAVTASRFAGTKPTRFGSPLTKATAPARSWLPE